jgi:hypothetical protein
VGRCNALLGRAAARVSFRAGQRFNCRPSDLANTDDTVGALDLEQLTDRRVFNHELLEVDEHLFGVEQPKPVPETFVTSTSEVLFHAARISSSCSRISRRAIASDR